VAPGETPNRAPAALAALTSAGVRRVPAPTTPPGTWAMARITSRAAGVRRVTSSAGRPPLTSASARGRAWARSSITRTGMTGARRQISAGVMGLSFGVVHGETGGHTACNQGVGGASSALLNHEGRARSHHQRRPFGGWADVLAEGCEQLSPDAEAVRRQVGLGQRAAVEIGDQCRQRAGAASSRTTSPSRSRASGPPCRRLGRDMDRGGHLARGPRHAPVGDQRHLQPAVLQAPTGWASANAVPACRWRAAPGSGRRRWCRW
jgi:hypothetical protein